MWAGTVVEPPGPASAAMVSVTSRSRSVAFKLSFERSARTRTLARIGIVLRRSTARCTWPSDFNNSERSTVTFIATFRLGRGEQKWCGPAHSARAQPSRYGLFPAFHTAIAHRRPQARATVWAARAKEPARAWNRRRFLDSGNRRPALSVLDLAS